MVMAQKRKQHEERIKRISMAAEGYRKAARLMEPPDGLDFRVLSFVDTAGAYPGRGAEERGQAEAIASAIQRAFACATPRWRALSVRWIGRCHRRLPPATGW